MTVQSYAEETAAILDWLDGRWAEHPIAKPNTRFEPPARAPYVEVRINRQTAFNAAIGSAIRVRHPGLLTLVVRVPVNSGDGLAIDIADDLASVFRNVRIDGSIQFRAPTVRDFGPSEGWYVVHVDCPFYRNSVF